MPSSPSRTPFFPRRVVHQEAVCLPLHAAMALLSNATREIGSSTLLNTSFEYEAFSASDSPAWYALNYALRNRTYQAIAPNHNRKRNIGNEFLTDEEATRLHAIRRWGFGTIHQGLLNADGVFENVGAPHE
eukprot:9563620-Karenia_brevis.AAC.1